MKLVHPNIDKILNFDLKNVFSLIIENPEEYFNLTNQLVMQSEGGDGDWVLSDVLPLELSKNILVIYDFYHLDCNNKKFDNMLKTEIMKLPKSVDFNEYVTNINKEIAKLNDKIISNLPIKVFVNDDISFEQILKLSKFSFKEETKLLERLINYIENYLQLSTLKVVVLIGSKSVLDNDHIKLLIKDLEYKDLKILLIDSQDRFLDYDCEKIIIDNDLCVI